MRNRINPDRGGGLQPYDRPNQTWRCGNEENGCPCSVGPLESGVCPETTECTPIKEGDRWICNRSEVRGGPCDQKNLATGADNEAGPSPDGQCCMVLKCQPKRTLRFFRGRWARGSALFALGLILIVLGSTSRNDLLAPGPLTTHHAQVIQRDQWQQRCATCHPGANESSVAWLGRAAGLTNTTITAAELHVNQSTLCLNCHETLRVELRAPMLAHGLPSELLRNHSKGPSRTASVAQQSGPIQQVSHRVDPLLNDSQDGIACAVCHQEHHGAEHDLLALSDARCQSCHQEQYQGFAIDHPEFSSWPTSGPTRITFSHQSHSESHFLKASQEFDCRVCHQEDSQGDLTARPAYQQTCAGCHDGELRQSFSQGVSLASLPSINEASLSEAGLSTLNWPAQATDDFDGSLPALMKILLAADPATADIMRSLGEDFSFFDIDPDDKEQVAKAAQMMMSIRNLFNEIQEEGHDAIGYRLKQVSGNSELKTDLAEFVSNLPIEYVDQLQAAWFNSAGTITTDTFEEFEDRESTGGWKLDSDRLTLSYHPTGHDDRMLKAWLDLIVQLPTEHSRLRDACLEEFKQPGAPGACLSCHSIQSNTNNQLSINWNGRDRLAEPKGFTHFSHRPHLTQPELANCTACHQISSMSKAMTLASASQIVNQTVTTQDFEPISQATCVQCHQPKGAGDNCSQCHNYHIDPLSLDLPSLRDRLIQ